MTAGLEIEAFAGRPTVQIAMVVRDFDAALARWWTDAPRQPQPS